jgi:hypothetical protein
MNAIEIGVCKALLKTGVNKHHIRKEEIELMQVIDNRTDWNCFLFYLESNFNIDISHEEENKLNSYTNVIQAITDRV